MNHIGLFEGIGGFSLAAQWAGWDTIAWCEIDPFCQKVLKYHFPLVTGYDDIKTTDFTIYRGRVDILTGGFPCQPYSHAGQRKGKADARHLWPEMLRAIREIRPRWVVGENVFGIINWNGGLVFNEVQADLEAEGYEVQSFVLPACAVNAPHRRDRVWFVAKAKIGVSANAESFGHRGRCGDGCSDREWSLFQDESKRRALGGEIEGCNSEWLDSNTEVNDDRWGIGKKSTGQESEFGNCTVEVDPNANSIGRRKGRRKSELNEQNCTQNYWASFPIESPICGGNDGIPQKLDTITVPKWRRESIKSFGNAIVPQVAYRIFKAINDYEHIVIN